MADTQKKIQRLNERISECDEKMKQVLAQKKEYERMRNELQEQEIINAVKSNGISIENLNDGLALIKLFQEHNFSKNDIMELLSTNSSTNHNQIYGGNQNENK